MKLYWGLSSIPELAALPKTERLTLWRQAHENARNTAAHLFRLLLLGLCAGTGSLIGDFSGSYYGMISAGIGGGIGGMLYSQLTIRAVLPHLRKLIAKDNSTVSATSL